MTKDEFRQIEDDSNFRNACVRLMEDVDEVTFEDVLQFFAGKQVKEGNYLLAKHLCEALMQGSSTELWRYDCGMGTLDTPTPINEFDDIEDLLEEE